ncbi:SusD/RagB family nutrient-binding outer membrane lipoprotein [Chitinophaga agrisoli]|uniref:SusD/RagB family nutrient-binding outer membrane lipoprotein n=1 Tax=Chitinophaga agrisoli TaxID=2607653 RepID=A0A5B2VSA7_9BACT|nr:SusD/RagB family nutrient-binding outer membrane lipoprotein [Chitinophaga agrisoli]
MKQLSIVILSALFAVSCTRNFDILSTDPNRPKEVTPGVMLGQLEYRMVNTAINEGRFFTHELMQVDAPRASNTGGGVHRYIINPGEGVWTDFYRYMTDIEDIYTISSGLGENNYKGIALVYKAWAYSILTDLYGDVPYSEATKGVVGNFLPAFDKQKDIYPSLLKLLDTANTLFTPGPLTYGGDLLYDPTNAGTGTMKWKKFANSLKLRLLLRISKRDGEVNVKEQINTLLADPAKYPMFTGNANEAIMKYPGTYPYFNPFYNTRQLEWRDQVYLTKFFIDQLNANGDPRRAVWATQVDSPLVYRGIESGYPTSVSYPVGDNSSYPDALKTFSGLGIMMTYAELEFIKAELALKGYNTAGTAQQHYEAGIRASMTQWGVTMPENFLQQPNVAYNAAGTVDAQLQQIMLQKYFAFFFTDYQSWFEKRRTGYPVLPRGSGIPMENKFPVRMPYPPYLQSLNPQRLAEAVAGMGGDNTNINVWWDK